jgi:uncharacterized protein YecE (DUF72 family)
MVDPIFNLLKKYNIGFCIFDMPGFTTPLAVTADFAYLRFHGKGGLYSGNYPDSDLASWAKQLHKLNPAPKSVYIYFNNDAGGYAIQNALTLKNYVT